MKVIISLIGVIFFYSLLGNISALTIPDEALRIRVIPNSNENTDIEIKNIIKEQIQYEMYDLLKNTKGINEAKSIIDENLTNIEKRIQKTLDLNNYQLNFTVDFGLNHFPEKEYKGIIYEEGYYESLVITIGEGKGDNWWCVLYPPLCLIEENTGEVQYTTYVQELIDKHL